MKVRKIFRNGILVVTTSLLLFAAPAFGLQAQGQGQLQAQGQIQLQGQAQGQFQGITDSANVRNDVDITNKNHNKNTNTNHNQNGNWNDNKNVNKNKNTNLNANINDSSNVSGSESSLTYNETDELSIMGAPGVNAMAQTDLTTYIGDYPETWNVQNDSLEFLLTQNRVFSVNKKSKTRFWMNHAKSKVSTIADQEGKDATFVMVYLSELELTGLDYTVMAIVTTHGNRKATTLDCFKQAVVDVSESGGNALLILKSSSDPGVHSSTIGLGGSGAGNFSQAGSEAFSAGTATGFSSNTGGPVSNPYIQAVSIRIN